jgi:tRNA1Val (adenine37-N6)-methyltransferase
MSHKPFTFKHFIVQQDKCAMKIGTDAMILGSWIQPGNAKNILDIGSGTGILSLMLAQKSNAAIDAVEIDETAFEQAKDNFQNSCWSHRLNIYHTAIQDFEPGHSYDIMISNPPYFGENLKSSAESEKYRSRKKARSIYQLSHHDLALHASRLLTDCGSFYIILPVSAQEVFIALAEKAGLYPVETLEILSKAGSSPVRIISVFCKRPVTHTVHQPFIIYEQDGQYTDNYIALTKEYYAVDMAKRKSDKLPT